MGSLIQSIGTVVGTFNDSDVVALTKEESLKLVNHVKGLFGVNREEAKKFGSPYLGRIDGRIFIESEQC